MTRFRFLTETARKTGFKQDTVAPVVREFFNVMTDFLSQGRAIEIHGLVTLKPVLKAGRPARNPRTMEPVYIEAHKSVKAVFPPSIRKAL